MLNNKVTLHTNLTNAIKYLEDIVHLRLKHHFDQSTETEIEFPIFEFKDTGEPFFQFIMLFELDVEEFIVLMLSIVPHLQPGFFENIMKTYMPNGGEFPEFGGYKTAEMRHLIPTGQTAIFTLAGTDLSKRLEVLEIFDDEHFFGREKILYLGDVKTGFSKLNGPVVLDNDYLELFTKGRIPIPKQSTNFPAQQLTSEMEWEDLVLNDNIRTQLKELECWLKLQSQLGTKWDLHKKIKPGYRVLFYGPPGTGKTLAVTLLGKTTEKLVFRIDLSKVVSKYIGETEKNLSALFDKAEHKDWILFFDEADALFGKRTNVSDAHDRYANQEVSYLLQRIEDFNGLVILASNFKSNMDEAFLRRFNAVIPFPFPSEEDRAEIWRKTFPNEVQFEEENLPDLLAKYELAGGNIINVVQYACLKTIARNSDVILVEDVLKGVEREFEKEDRVFKRNTYVSSENEVV